MTKISSRKSVSTGITTPEIHVDARTANLFDPKNPPTYAEYVSRYGYMTQEEFEAKKASNENHQP